jgi:hypothetical protein
MPVTQAELEARRGVNIGFFYLREKGKESPSLSKVQVFVKGTARNVWTGAQWCSLDSFERDEVVEASIRSTIAACREFNGELV